MAEVQEPRPAATVIAARQGPEGVEVLVLQRGSRSRFLPGYVVFPGGAVDPADVEHAARWFGTSAEAARACAVRELSEEAGLVLTADGLRAAACGELGPVDAAPPRAEQLSEISHWIAPEEVPVRFDARYYALAAPMGVEPSPDGAEAAHVWWARPRDVMGDWAAGRARLYWPTMKTMESIARCETVEDLLAMWIPQQEPEGDEEEVMPRSTFYQD